MAVLTNSCEGGTPSAAVTTANSGGTSGTAFDRVEDDSPVTYSAVAAHGSVGILCNGSSDAYVGWESGIPGTSPTLWARVYARFDSVPASNTNILRMLSSSNGIMGTVRINSNGTLGQLWGTGMFGGNTTLSVTLGQWFRVEFAVTAGGSNNGTMVTRVFWDPEATTPSQELTSSNVTTGAVNPTRLRAGVLSSAAAVILDDIALSDEGWIGPVTTGGGTPVEGTAAAASALNAHIVGKRTVAGAAHTALEHDAGAAAVRTVHGAAAALLGAATAATGSRAVTATAGVQIGGTASAQGTRTAVGAATANLGAMSAHAAGTRTITAGATAPLGFEATAAGSASGRVEGAAEAAFTIIAAAAGHRQVHGTAQTLAALTAAAATRRLVQGETTANLGGLQGHATGQRHVEGTAASPLEGAASAAGHRSVTAEATAQLVFTAGANATQIAEGTATAALGGLNTEATGHRTVHGTMAAPLRALTATATGSRTAGAAATAPLTLTARAAAHRTVQGTAGTTLVVTATAAGHSGHDVDVTITVGPATRGWAAGPPTRNWTVGTPSK